MRDRIKAELKPLIISSLRLQDVTPDDLGDDHQLLDGSLELDSIDILQLIVTIEKHFSVELVTGEFNRQVWQTIDTLAAAIEAKLSESTRGPVPRRGPSVREAD